MFYSNSKTSEVYWSSYRILENKLIRLAHSITFDDEQIDVYSPELADIINSACIKIESIAKDIYEEHICPFQEDKNETPFSEIKSNNKKKQTEFDYSKWKRKKWKYDYNCLVEIDHKYSLSNKKICLKKNKFQFTKYGSLLLPFSNISITDCRGGIWEYNNIDVFKYNENKVVEVDWCKSYQDIKHNYLQSISKHGTIKNAIMVLAAYYLLMIYHSCLPVKKFELTQKEYDSLDFNSELFYCDMCNYLKPPFIIDSEYNDYIEKSKLDKENSPHKNIFKQQDLLDNIEGFPFYIILNEKRYNELKKLVFDYLEKNNKEVFDIALCKNQNNESESSQETILYEIIRKYINAPYRMSDVCVAFNSGANNVYNEYSYSSFEYEKSKFEINNKNVLSKLNVDDIVNVKFVFDDEFENAKVINFDENCITIEIFKDDIKKQYSAPISNIIFIKKVLL